MGYNLDIDIGHTRGIDLDYIIDIIKDIGYNIDIDIGYNKDILIDTSIKH